MPSKKQRLKELKGDWTAAEISVSYRSGLLNDKSVKTVEDAYEILNCVWSKELINLQEQFMALYFNRSNKLIGWRLLNTGTLSCTLVDVKLLSSLALHCMACS